MIPYCFLPPDPPAGTSGWTMMGLGSTCQFMVPSAAAALKVRITGDYSVLTSMKGGGIQAVVGIKEPGDGGGKGPLYNTGVGVPGGDPGGPIAANTLFPVPQYNSPVLQQGMINVGNYVFARTSTGLFIPFSVGGNIPVNQLSTTYPIWVDLAMWAESGNAGLAVNDLTVEVEFF